MSPQRCPVLIPGTCKYITFRGHRGFANVIKDLEMGRLPWWALEEGGKKVGVREGDQYDSGSRGWGAVVPWATEDRQPLKVEKGRK